MKFLLLTLLLIGSCFAADQTVTMKSLSFDPKLLQIKAGDNVEWVNKSHTTHSAVFKDEASLNSGDVAPTKTSRKVMFSKPGRYPYHCKIHGETMSATVEVK